jgi:hypothetical protein
MKVTKSCGSETGLNSGSFWNELPPFSLIYFILLIFIKEFQVKVMQKYTTFSTFNMTVASEKLIVEKYEKTFRWQRGFFTADTVR